MVRLVAILDRHGLWIDMEHMAGIPLLKMDQHGGLCKYQGMKMQLNDVERFVPFPGENEHDNIRFS